MAEKKYKCPICEKPVQDADSRLFPFCSERCKLVDLEAWLRGRYYVPGEPVDVEAEPEESDDSSAEAG